MCSRPRPCPRPAEGAYFRVIKIIFVELTSLLPSPDPSTIWSTPAEGAIDWSGQDYLIEVLLLDQIRGDSTARPEVRALVQRVLRHFA